MFVEPDFIYFVYGEFGRSYKKVGGIVIGREKIWALAYADDIMLLVKDER